MLYASRLPVVAWQGGLDRACAPQPLRERRGGVEPPAEPPLSKGFALVDKSTYASMLPDEQVELNLFGFKVAYALTTKSP